jgi:hypothetical protein
VINHSDVDLVLDRIVLELRAGQPFHLGLMAHRTPIPPHSTVSTIWYYGLLTEGAVALIREYQEKARTGAGSLQVLQVFPRGYFDSPTLRFPIEGRNISRHLPAE